MTTITEARLTAEQLDELRKVAEAATPGPWTEKEIGWWQNDILAPDGHAVVKAATRPAGASNANGGVARVKDRTHIASFDPPTALALLDRIAVLTEALTSISEMPARHSLEVGFNHGPLSTRELLARLDEAKEIAIRALANAPAEPEDSNHGR